MRYVLVINRKISRRYSHGSFIQMLTFELWGIELKAVAMRYALVINIKNLRGIHSHGSFVQMLRFVLWGN